MIRKIFISLLLCLAFTSVSADEGLWLPSLIGSRIKDMRQKGFKLSAEDIYSATEASMKDAVVLFGTGSTAGFISDEGLLLTNHHCAVGHIRKLSTPERDLIRDGFWARSREEELPISGLTVRRLVRMEDVTARVAAGESAADIAREASQEGLVASVEPIYYGNQYYLFVYEVFSDVRLVAAPPASIGMFGNDTDCWFWPRHTCDFAILRVYADDNNRAAKYSVSNRPYRPAYHFTISTKGIGEGDFAMVYGNPNNTQEYVTSHAVEYIAEVANPMKIALREKRLAIIDTAMSESEPLRQTLAASRSSLSKTLRRWQGEMMGLRDADVVAKYRQYEDSFAAWAKSRAEYSALLDSMGVAYTEVAPEYFVRELYTESVGVVSIFNFARTLGLSARSAKSTTESIVAQIAKFQSSYNRIVDEPLAAVMLEEFLQRMPAERIPVGVKQAVEQRGGAKEFVKWLFTNTAILKSSPVTKPQIAEDVMVEFAMAFVPIVEHNRKYAYSALSRVPAIERWYGPYMRALQEWDTDREFYPDANKTLRVAYGKVEGYVSADGEYHAPFTTIDEVVERASSDVPDYKVPEPLIEIFKARNYGRWGAKIDGKKSLPVCFMTTAHTSGGNSGSPMLNARGELVGINFHRTWHTAMSDVEFDASVCRNVAVDIRYVLFVVERIGEAGYLLEEMDLR